jgi:hypothetical protein
MGLFCLPTTGTVEDHVKCAVGNLNLFVEDKCSGRSDYLLEFAIKNVEDALNRLNSDRANEPL